MMPSQQFRITYAEQTLGVVPALVSTQTGLMLMLHSPLNSSLNQRQTCYLSYPLGNVVTLVAVTIESTPSKNPFSASLSAPIRASQVPTSGWFQYLR